MQKVLATFKNTGESIDPDSEVLADLRKRLALHDPEGYPVQHATASFHLGSALLAVGQTEEAEELFARAVPLFEGRLPLEHAKALNMLGTAQRQAGRADEAVASFTAAAARFDESGHGLEHGASCFNLGLVHMELAQPGEAVAQFRKAQELLPASEAPVEAAAATRELGAALLADGAYAEAATVLRDAVQQADDMEDTEGMGAAANALGLALVAAGDPAAAMEAFGTALSAHPRSLRPSDFAIVKANMALAHEQSGDLPRARLAARQALGVVELPEAVLDSAMSLLERIGTPRTADLLAVLDSQPQQHLPALLREELAHLAVVPQELRELEAGEWVDALAANQNSAYELVVSWLEALLELPHPAMTRVIGATVAAMAPGGQASEDAAHTFRAALERGYARFHPPQADRVRQVFESAETGSGEPAWA